LFYKIQRLLLCLPFVSLAENNKMPDGKLYLIPSFLGETKAEKVFPLFNHETIVSLSYFIVEEIRTARRFLKSISKDINIDSLNFYLLNEHTRPEEISTYLDAALKGFDIGLLSEAGMPCIADPGAAIVRMAHEKGIAVVPLTGPSSIFLALSASGFNGQNFVFHGYLPIDRATRDRKIKEIEQQAHSKNQTQIFIETPYRNLALFEALLEVCRSETALCIAADITSDSEFIKTRSIAEWKKQRPELHKKPAVFLIG
jgi:16S rRNA (cytidine1402-2'-O)-methyltransferase